MLETGKEQMHGVLTVFYSCKNEFCEQFFFLFWPASANVGLIGTRGRSHRSTSQFLTHHLWQNSHKHEINIHKHEIRYVLPESGESFVPLS